MMAVSITETSISTARLSNWEPNNFSSEGVLMRNLDLRAIKFNSFLTRVCVWRECV